jgi:hypothetical protein
VAREVLITIEDWKRMKSMVEADGGSSDSELHYVEDVNDDAVPDELDGEYRQ